MQVDDGLSLVVDTDVVVALDPDPVSPVLGTKGLGEPCESHIEKKGPLVVPEIGHDVAFVLVWSVYTAGKVSAIVLRVGR